MSVVVDNRSISKFDCVAGKIVCGAKVWISGSRDRRSWFGEEFIVALTNHSVSELLRSNVNDHV